MTKTMDLSKKQGSQASKTENSLKPVSFGIVIAMWFIYITLLAVNLVMIPDFHGEYTTFAYLVGVLVRVWSPFLLLAVMIAICVMLVKAKTQPFRFLARYAVLLFILTICLFPYTSLNCPTIASLLVLVLAFVMPIISLGRYMYAKRSMTANERRRREKVKVVRAEQDVEAQKKYGVAGVVIGVAAMIPTLIATTANSMTNLVFFCMVITFLAALPMGLVTAIILIVRFVKTNRKMDNTAFLLNLAGIVLCLLPLGVVLFQLFTS